MGSGPEGGDALYNRGNFVRPYVRPSRPPMPGLRSLHLGLKGFQIGRRSHQLGLRGFQLGLMGFLPCLEGLQLAFKGLQPGQAIVGLSQSSGHPGLLCPLRGPNLSGQASRLPRQASRSFVPDQEPRHRAKNLDSGPRT